MKNKIFFVHIIKGILGSLIFFCSGCVVASKDLSVAGIRPTKPEAKGVYTAALGPYMAGASINPSITNVDSLQPTIQWEAYSGIHKANRDKFKEPNIQNVSYELRIWPQEGFSWNKPVYRKKDIKETRHTLEQPLQSDSVYYWSIRAWFDLNGQRRVSEWSLAFTHYFFYNEWVKDRNEGQIDFRNFFRFETP